MKQQGKNRTWVRVMCWILAGIMILGMAATGISFVISLL